jgi:putative NIF3 family GTP cyclohydrolase 1 type 2
MNRVAVDIDRHMRQVGAWVDFSRTCDTFKSGDPATAIRAIAVSWMSTTRALRQAVETGCNVFVTHEPTFYSHMDNDPAVEADACTREKRTLLAETGLVVYRCHDVWDRVPGDGILDSWAACLGFAGPPAASETFMRVYEIEPTPAAEFARRVLQRIRPFGQEATQLTGDPDRVVHRVGIGTGAIAYPRSFHALGADLAIVTELAWWREARWAQDAGLSLLVVDHTVSEEPGMISLAAYLRRVFPDVRVEYIPTHCPWRLVAGE